MTLEEEAIQRLRIVKDDYLAKGCPNHAQAIQLGIEALEREQAWRRRWPHQSHLPFPGETKE